MYILEGAKCFPFYVSKQNIGFHSLMCNQRDFNKSIPLKHVLTYHMNLLDHDKNKAPWAHFTRYIV